MFLLVISVILATGAGNAVNDIFDIEIDKVNRPDRPLPSGAMTLRGAKIYTTIMFAVGVSLAGLISIENLIIAGPISVTLLYAYSAWFKRMPLIGNLTVSLMMGLAFIYVGVAFNNIYPTLVMAALAFSFTFIREIVKDLEDMEGDARDDARTLPLVWGEQKTILLVLFLMAAFVVLDLLPYALGVYNQIYLWVVIFGINIPLLVFAFFMWKQPTKKSYSRVQLFLKLDIFVGLAALYFGQTF